MITLIQIIAGESRFVHFPLVIYAMGKVKVTVYAESQVNRQEVTKTVTIRVRVHLVILIRCEGVILRVTGLHNIITAQKQIDVECNNK